MKPTTIALLQKCKQEKKRFATITAYDHSFAKLFADEGINVLLVGDSLGMTVQGHDSTLPVTVEDIAYHTRAVRRGAPNSLLLADLPFMAYATPEQTFANAAIVMRAGANMVKLEGGAWLADTVRMLAERAVPVCGHLGLTPQSVNVFGGYKVQGRGDAAQTLFEDALALEAAGAQLLVLECVPVELAKRITDALTIPVIGIGAGNVTKLCNQTIVVMMEHQLIGAVYAKDGAEHEELAMDIANSGVTIAGLIPWCIACAVPLSMLGVGVEALPYACLLYLIPLCYLFTKRFFFPAKFKGSETPV